MRDNRSKPPFPQRCRRVSQCFEVRLMAPCGAAGAPCRARGLPVQTVRTLVAAATETRTLGILGEPRVNVLKLNLALDALPES